MKHKQLFFYTDDNDGQVLTINYVQTLLAVADERHHSREGENIFKNEAAI